MNLEGKAAVVTGSGRGIGRAYARALAQAGCAVVVNDVDADVAEAFAIWPVARRGDDHKVACVSERSRHVERRARRAALGEVV